MRCYPEQKTQGAAIYWRKSVPGWQHPLPSAHSLVASIPPSFAFLRALGRRPGLGRGDAAVLLIPMASEPRNGYERYVMMWTPRPVNLNMTDLSFDARPHGNPLQQQPY